MSDPQSTIIHLSEQIPGTCLWVIARTTGEVQIANKLNLKCGPELVLELTPGQAKTLGEQLIITALAADPNAEYLAKQAAVLWPT